MGDGNAIVGIKRNSYTLKWETLKLTKETSEKRG